jgi:hypothetical protein
MTVPMANATYSGCLRQPDRHGSLFGRDRGQRSRDEFSTRAPSGEKAALLSRPSWPFRTAIALPVAASLMGLDGTVRSGQFHDDPPLHPALPVPRDQADP